MYKTENISFQFLYLHFGLVSIHVDPGIFLYGFARILSGHWYITDM